ncbi:urease accessory protein UreF [Planctomycetota bacterium]|nr:urease accessory protein UreF [Planctomycetota bacterium]
MIPSDGTWLLLQLADSAFPTGGFAHSSGIEAAAQLGMIRDQPSLTRWLTGLADQAGRLLLPYAAAAWDDTERWPEIDQRCDAQTANLVANRASRAQGQALLHAAAALAPAIEAAKRELRRKSLPGHAAPAAGLVYRHLGCTRDDALRLVLFTNVRGWISAAVRLGLIGPLAAQAMQRQLDPALDAALADGRQRPLDQAAASMPWADLAQGHHDRLYSRLFAS